MNLQKKWLIGILFFFISAIVSAQNSDLLFSPEGIAEIHITLADNKNIDEIQNEKATADYRGKVKATMTIKNSNTSTYDESQFYTGNILIDGRGNTSWHQPKRPYNIDLVENDWITELSAKLLGMPECDEWALLNFWVDRSVMRIPLAFYLGQRMTNIPWTPRNRYVEVWINGDYRGLYLLTEKVQRDNNRVDVKKNDETTNNLTGGYILEATPKDGHKSTPIETQTQIQTGPYGINFAFKYPKPKNLTNPYGESQRQWIKEWMDDFEDALGSNDYRDPTNGYQRYINENSFIDWTILHELSKGCDNLFHASIFVQKERDGKLSMTAPWDFDLSFGNSGVYQEENNWIKTHRWFGRLDQDDRYAQKYITRHEELVPLIEKIPEILRANYQQLEEAGVLEREYQKYPNIIDDFKSDGEGRKTPTTYKGHVQFLSEWVMSRHNWMYINLGRTDAEKGQRMKNIRPVIRIMDPEAITALRAFDVKVMRSEDNDNNNKYTYSWNNGPYEKKASIRITQKGKYWVKIKDQWGNVSLASDTLDFASNDPRPIANWTATASSFDPDEEPSNAVDNNPNTKWDLGTGQTGEDWIIVDMKERQNFNTIVLRQEGGGSTYPRLCEVYVSNDGFTWGNPVVLEAGSNEGVVRMRLPQTYDVRYIKLMQKRRSTSNSSWVIYELTVENSSYTSWFSSASYADIRQNAKNALDNDYSTRWALGTAQKGEEWFVVDLLEPKWIEAIVLKQTGYENDYPREYKVYLGPDFNRWGRPILSGSGTAGQETRIVLPAPQNARCIKIEQTGSANNWWSITEFLIEESGMAIPQFSNSQVRVSYRDGQLQVFNASQDAKLTIYSISGQIVKQTELAPGVYIVVITDAQQVYKEKLIVR